MSSYSIFKPLLFHVEEYSATTQITHTSQKRNYTMRTIIPHLLFYFTLLLISPASYNVYAIEAQWTPNEEEGAGPLPLSMKQRQELLQLDQAIAQSPDPQATLEKVAQSNDMSPKELGDMLVRNRMDLQQQEGGSGVGVGGSRLKAIGNLLFAMLFQLVRYARANPQRFGAVASCLFMILWMIYTAPR